MSELPTSSNNNAVVVVDTPSGQLRGSLALSCLGDQYYAFRGVPYARPPVGALRFRDPEPAEPWPFVRDALTHGPISLQYDAVASSVKGSEDCLYANVYSKCLEPDRRSPVMVWVHGGGFILGSGDDDAFGPDYFLAKDVVLVTFNYRLGVFGFLNLEDEVAPGNQGLKDQAMLLRWVRTHISSFGGDPENVTVFGGSAGACSVHYLTMSPLARDLFHKAICQSGAAINLWGVKHEPRKAALEFLEILGCREKCSRSILEFLKNADPKRMIEAQTKLTPPLAWIRLNLPFGPGIDDKSSKPFMPVHPWLAAEEGVQVPLMIGYNSLEGIFFLNFLDSLNLSDIDRNLEQYCHPKLPDLLRGYSSSLKDLRQLYFNSDEISERNVRKYVEFLSDVAFVEGVHRLVKIQFHNSAAPTYLYRFCFDRNPTLGKKTIVSRLGKHIEGGGANHGDELTYLFKSGADQLREGTGAERVMRQMIELWVNFAKIGRPTPATSDLIPLYWQPLASDVVLRYLNIDEDLRMEKMLNIEQRYASKKYTRYAH